MIGPHTRLMMLSYTRECEGLERFSEKQDNQAAQDTTREDNITQHKQKARLHKAKEDNTRELSTAQMSTTRHDTR